MTDQSTASQQLREIRERFPYMFPQSAWGFVFYRGWLPLTVRVCEEIDVLLGDDKRGFCWTQIKEKFGSARFYYNVRSTTARAVDVGTKEKPLTVMADWKPTEPVVREIARIVAAATDESLTTCQVCGASAERHSYVGYVVTLCGEHQAKGADDDAWHGAIIGARLDAPKADADEWVLHEGRDP